MYVICVEWKNQNVPVALNQKKSPVLAEVVIVKNVAKKKVTHVKGRNAVLVNR